MSTIWMDPVELRSAADLLHQEALHLQESVTGLRSTCTCEVPLSLAGWLSEELAALEQQGLVVSLSYLLDALDSAVRADQIGADQSLAGVQPELATVAAAYGGLAATTTVGGGVSLSIGGDPYSGILPPDDGREDPIQMMARLGLFGGVVPAGPPYSFLIQPDPGLIREPLPWELALDQAAAGIASGPNPAGNAFGDIYAIMAMGVPGAGAGASTAGAGEMLGDIEGSMSATSVNSIFATPPGTTAGYDSVTNQRTWSSGGTTRDSLYNLYRNPETGRYGL